MTPQTNGIRKAAVLVASLSRQAADRLLDQMDPQQAKAVRQAVLEMGPIDPDEQRRIVDEFFRLRPMVPRPHSPGIELDGRLAERLSWGPPRYAREEAAPSTASDGPPFRFLHDAGGEKLARLLESERPQTVALVVAHLPPQQAANVLARLTPALQVDVVRRLVDLEEPEPDILREVERVLESRFSKQVLMQRRRVAGLAAVAEILEASEGQVGMQVLDNLALHDRRLAERLRPVRLDFDDLARLPDPTLATIFPAAEPPLAVLALVGAPPALLERVLQALSESQAKSVRRQLHDLGPTRLRDVEEARRRIAELAQRLALEGRIEIPWAQPSVRRCTETPEPV